MPSYMQRPRESSVNQVTERPATEWTSDNMKLNPNIEKISTEKGDTKGAVTILDKSVKNNM